MSDLVLVLLIFIAMLLFQLWSYKNDIERSRETQTLQDNLLNKYRESEILNKESQELDSELIRILKESITDKNDYIVRLNQHIEDLNGVLNGTR